MHPAISIRCHWDQLDDGSDWHAQESDEDAEKPLCRSERSCVCEITKKFNYYNLEGDGTGKDTHKHIIPQHAFEDINLLHLSGAYLIENLKKELQG